jgi:hypothetical protein
MVSFPFWLIIRRQSVGRPGQVSPTTLLEPLVSFNIIISYARLVHEVFSYHDVLIPELRVVSHMSVTCLVTVFNQPCNIE